MSPLRKQTIFNPEPSGLVLGVFGVDSQILFGDSSLEENGMVM